MHQGLSTRVLLIPIQYYYYYNSSVYIQDNFIRNHSLEAIKIYNPSVKFNIRDANSGVNVAATFAVDFIERQVYWWA